MTAALAERGSILDESDSSALVEALRWMPPDTAVILHGNVARATVSDQCDDLPEPAALGARVAPEREEPIYEGVALVPARSAAKLCDQRHYPRIPPNRCLFLVTGPGLDE